MLLQEDVECEIALEKISGWLAECFRQVHSGFSISVTTILPFSTLPLVALTPAPYKTVLGRLQKTIGVLSRSGLAQARAKLVEHTWAPMFREAVAIAKERHLFRSITLPVDPSDNPRIDVLATGAFLNRPCFCDATVRCPLKGNCEPHPHAAGEKGAVLREALKEKEEKYSDVNESPLSNSWCWPAGTTRR